MSRLDDLRRFYDVLDHLAGQQGGPRAVSQLSSRDCPQRGVYFFLEPGENRSNSGNGSRVVRVGTHALKPGSKSTLGDRLRQHRGVTKSGGGNHRGSIFRLLVGLALTEREPSLGIESWSRGSSADRATRDAELGLERLVSDRLGQMQVLVMSVEDEPGPDSLRGYVERNSIALLSNYQKTSLDPPSKDWLGAKCPRARVQQSGLWNNNHVDEDYDPVFLDTLEKLT